MKIVVVTHRSEDHGPDDFEPYLAKEAKKAFAYMEEDFVREIYSFRNGKGAILIVEAETEDDAHAKLSELPLATAGLLRFELYPVKAFRAIKPLADML